MNLGYVNILPQATVESDALAPLCFLFFIIIFFFLSHFEMIPLPSLLAPKIPSPINPRRTAIHKALK